MLSVTAAIGVTIANRGTVIGEKRRLRGMVAAVMPTIVRVLNLKIGLSSISSISSTEVVVVVPEPHLMPSTTLASIS